MKKLWAVCVPRFYDLSVIWEVFSSGFSSELQSRTILCVWSPAEWKCFFVQNGPRQRWPGSARLGQRAPRWNQPIGMRNRWEMQLVKEAEPLAGPAWSGFPQTNKAAIVPVQSGEQTPPNPDPGGTRPETWRESFKLEKNVNVFTHFSPRGARWKPLE